MLYHVSLKIRPHLLLIFSPKEVLWLIFRVMSYFYEQKSTFILMQSYHLSLKHKSPNPEVWPELLATPFPIESLSIIIYIFILL